MSTKVNGVGDRTGGCKAQSKVTSHDGSENLAKLADLRLAMTDGELSGDAGPLNMQATAHEAQLDQATENWLREQAGPAFDALKADPSRAVILDQVRARLADEHAKQK